MKCRKCKQIIKGGLTLCALDGKGCWHERCAPRKKFDSKEFKRLAKEITGEREMCACGHPQSFPMPHLHSLSDRELAIKGAAEIGERERVKNIIKEIFDGVPTGYCPDARYIIARL